MGLKDFFKTFFKKSALALFSPKALFMRVLEKTARIACFFIKCFFTINASYGNINTMTFLARRSALPRAQGHFYHFLVIEQKMLNMYRGAQ